MSEAREEIAKTWIVVDSSKRHWGPFDAAMKAAHWAAEKWPGGNWEVEPLYTVVG